MEWDLKATSWDFAELERDNEHTISSVVGFTGLGGQGSKGDCSVDLKLGRLGDLGETPVEKWTETRAPQISSPSSSSKRTRGTSSGSQTATCLVDGCKSDLSTCRDYHRRHKVCEVHAKTPVVMVGGQQQRFCQQCSRFHSLKEFDEVKRSCRKRLDGHNRRRRKPQPDSISASSSTWFPNHQGSRVSAYGQIVPNPLPDTSWPNAVKTEDETLYGCHASQLFDRQHVFSVSYPRGYKENKPFAFGGAGNHIDPSPSGPTFYDTITATSSDCALSLLSSGNENSNLPLSHVIQPDRATISQQPLISPLSFVNTNGHVYSRFTQPSNTASPMGLSAMEEEHVTTSVLVSDHADPGIHEHDIFHVGAGEGGPGSGAVSTLPMFWHS